jgi:metal-dependent hydrolase (beta-lactamase superfamily II)
VATHITNLCAAAKASRESAKGTANDAGPVAPQGSSHKGGEAPEEEGSGNAEQLVAVVGGLHLIGGKEMEARAKDTAQVGGRCPSHHTADSFCFGVWRQMIWLT